MTQRRRDAVRHEFNLPTSSLRVCLLSTKLAEGLNLVGANHLVQLDASWNPSTVGRRASIPRESVVPRLDLTLTRRASFRCNATRSHKFALLLLVVARPHAHTLETVELALPQRCGRGTRCALPLTALWSRPSAVRTPDFVVPRNDRRRRRRRHL